MHLLQELLRVEKSARPYPLGALQTYRYTTQTPRFSFETLVHFLPGDAGGVVVRAKNGYNDALAESLLARTLAVLGKARPQDVMAVVEGLLHPSALFDRLVVLPPSVARCFDHQSDRLKEACFWALPAFEGEFLSGQGRAEFVHQHARKDGGRIEIADWNRVRNPASSCR